MTLEKLYKSLGGEYDEVLGRLKSEALIRRLIKMFPEDTSYSRLSEGIKNGDGEEAFIGAHSLTGVCKSLGFKKLSESAGRVTEALRGKDMGAVSEKMLSDIASDYEFTLYIAKSLAK